MGHLSGPGGQALGARGGGAGLSGYWPPPTAIHTHVLPERREESVEAARGRREAGRGHRPIASYSGVW